jgi:hypothetical protein
LNEGGKIFGLYNHKKNLFVATTSIKHHACEKYLYGEDDEIEAIISKQESTIATMFSRMIKHLLPPADDSNALKVLLRYVLYQKFRTTKLGDDLLDSLNKALKATFDHVYGPENILHQLTGHHRFQKEFIM